MSERNEFALNLAMRSGWNEKENKRNTHDRDLDLCLLGLFRYYFHNI